MEKKLREWQQGLYRGEIYNIQTINLRKDLLSGIYEGKGGKLVRRI